MGFVHLLAGRTRAMDVNVIGEILKVGSQPGMVSPASGIAAPESFPMEIMRELTAIVIDKYASAAFQYDPTQGFGINDQARFAASNITGLDNFLVIFPSYSG